MTNRSMERPHGLNMGMIPDAIMDLLTIDQGWWSIPTLAERLGESPRSVSRALYRLRGRGLVRNPMPGMWAAA